MLETADDDTSAVLLEQVRQALENRTPLLIQGANSKAFLGRSGAGEVLDTRAHRGIVSYDPTELVITARAGTPLRELQAALDAAGQARPWAAWSPAGCQVRGGPGPVRYGISSSAPGSSAARASTCALAAK
jgi:FAD/FMN-containing dehydrogenase